MRYYNNMLEALAFLLLRIVSAVACAWVVWVLLWMTLDVAAAARAVVASVKLASSWPKAVATVTANHPDADVRNARISIAFDLPGGGSAAATLPKFAPYLWAPSAKGPQVFLRTLGRGLLASVAEYRIGSKVAVVFEPADPRRAEHRVGVSLGAFAVATRAAPLFFLVPLGLGLVATLLEYLVLA